MRVPGRIAPPAARDQRQHRRVPADRGAVRPRARLRSAASRTAARRDDRRDAPGRGRSARSRPRLDRDRRAAGAMTRAIFFDVDFTLIYPGPVFQGSGYRDSCARYGISVDPGAFDAAVSAASPLLEFDGGLYDPEIFVLYTRRIIEGMGGA